MNIFILDLNVAQCAEYHLDKHVVKMPLESAQLLCTAHWVTHFFGHTPCKLDNYEAQKLRFYSKEYDTYPYRPAMPNHPCSVWVRSSMQNYMWLMSLAIALGYEYTHRYKRKHKSTQVLQQLPSIGLPDNGLTPFIQAMPIEHQNIDPVVAYRKYYTQEKRYIASWTNRNTPDWWGKEC